MKVTVWTPEYLNFMCWKYDSDQLNRFWVIASQSKKLGAHLFKQAHLFGKIRYWNFLALHATVIFGCTVSVIKRAIIDVVILTTIVGLCILCVEVWLYTTGLMQMQILPWKTLSPTIEPWIVNWVLNWFDYYSRVECSLAQAAAKWEKISFHQLVSMRILGVWCWTLCPSFWQKTLF